MELNKYEVEHIFSFAADVDPKMWVQKLPTRATRITGAIVGGKVWGPKINGKLAPLGADWSKLYPNGIIQVDVRAMIETDDGASINLFYKGRLDLGSEEAAVEYSNGKFPPKMAFEVMPVMDTDDERYAWVNNCCCYAIGRVDFTADPIVVQYDVYRYKALL